MQCVHLVDGLGIIYAQTTAEDNRKEPSGAQLKIVNAEGAHSEDGKGNRLGKTKSHANHMTSHMACEKVMQVSFKPAANVAPRLRH